MKITIKLPGGRSGFTGLLRDVAFKNGEAVVEGDENSLEALSKVFVRNFEAVIEGEVITDEDAVDTNLTGSSDSLHDPSRPAATVRAVHTLLGPSLGANAEGGPGNGVSGLSDAAGSGLPGATSAVAPESTNTLSSNTIENSNGNPQESSASSNVGQQEQPSGNGGEQARRDGAGKRGKAGR